MAKVKKSAKQIQIDKANVKIVLVVSAAAVITAFSLVGAKTLVQQQAYQSKVIGVQKKALDVAEKDVVAAEQLASRYGAFDAQKVNIIKGTKDGTTPQDGSNSKIVLDALPSKYDFPALISSLEKILKDRGFQIESLSGTDDISQAEVEDTANPQPIEIPFQFSVTGSYASIQDLITVLDRSIRPIAITNIELSGSEQEITVVVSAKTYYQPGKNLNVKTQVVK